MAKSWSIEYEKLDRERLREDKENTLKNFTDTQKEVIEDVYKFLKKVSKDKDMQYEKIKEEVGLTDIEIQSVKLLKYRVGDMILGWDEYLILSVFLEQLEKLEKEEEIVKLQVMENVYQLIKGYIK